MISLRARAGELATFVGRGDFSIPELIEAYSSLLSGAPSRLVLWDFTEAKLTGERDDLAMWRLAVTAVRLAEGRRTTGRTAIVCSCPEDFNHASTLRTYLRIAGYPVLVKEFVDLEIARSWLMEEPRT